MRRASLFLVGLVAVACKSGEGHAARPADFPPIARDQVVEWVYDGKLASGWQDYGYATHGKSNAGPQELNLSNYSGWILARPGLPWEELGALTFRYEAPASLGDFLDVKLAMGEGGPFPVVTVTASHRVLRDGWHEVRIPMEELNPDREGFDRFRIKARRSVPSDWIRFDRIGFLRREPGSAAAAAPAEPFDAALAVDCKGPKHRISRYVYGITSSHKLDTPYAELGATIGRWGGNTSSRYNWEHGAAWNAGSDWYFRNVSYANPGFTWRDELNHNLSVGVTTALTVPMLGWVAKDVRSSGFPVSVYGPQESADGDAGNGVTPGGTKIAPGPPSRTSIPAPPEFVGRWVSEIRALDQKRGKRAVTMYFLDNEPGLWHDTHRDVHPAPLTYDELLEKTIAYGEAVRRADPEALIAGPSEWGWTGYEYSAADIASGWRLRPDRLAHGNVPLVQWYLRKLAAHEKKTGVRILDVLDLHFYPQARNMGLMETGGTDSATNALRLRSTRALWDPTYLDESWIKERVELIPRLKRWVEENYPGLKISIGEWNWGAEGHMSGGLAVAEVLGRMGQQDLFAAFYWRAPGLGTPAAMAFRAYGNYDGKGARFPDWSLPTRSAEMASLFAARDEGSGRVVLIALNLDPKRPARANLRLEGCGELKPSRAFVYAGGQKAFEERPAPPSAAGTVELPPYSMTVLELSAAK